MKNIQDQKPGEFKSYTLKHGIVLRIVYFVGFILSLLGLTYYIFTHN